MKAKNLFFSAFFCLTGVIFLSLTGCTAGEDGENGGSTVKDASGNVYHTVTIGTQTWMVENLQTTKFRNGVDIPLYTYAQYNTWYASTTSGILDVGGSQTGTANRFYNGYAAVDSRNIAPAGWHVATKADWETLIAYLGGTDAAGGALKDSTSASGWRYPNTGATNSSGFKAQSFGSLYSSGLAGVGYYAIFWTSTPFNEAGVCAASLSNSNAKALLSEANDIHAGCSVRCVKD